MTSNETTDKFDQKLFSVDEKKYGEKFKTHLLEQYKLCVEMADKNSERRAASNNFYLTLTSALIAIIGILSQVGPPVGNLYFWWVALVSFSGIVFCILWHASIKCYRTLSDAKFKIINEIEEKLPVAAFAKEWSYLNPGCKKTKYPQLTLVERWIPIMFLILFLVLMIVSVIAANYSSL